MTDDAQPAPPSLERLTTDRAPEVVEVFSQAFADYPVMRFVLGEHPDHVDRLRTLIGFFVAARAQRQGILLGMVLDDGSLGGAATVTPPEQGPVTDELRKLKRRTWEALGADAEARYAELNEVWSGFDRPEPHHHLNMIGVPPRYQGLGWASRLLREVHRIADQDPGSSGVSLTTETAGNIPIYKHFGYIATGPLPAGSIETWGCFRPSPGADARGAGRATGRSS